ncbi:hypothetical protein ABH933_005933 [Nocardia sp. GP40]
MFGLRAATALDHNRCRAGKIRNCITSHRHAVSRPPHISEMAFTTSAYSAGPGNAATHTAIANGPAALGFPSHERCERAADHASSWRFARKYREIIVNCPKFPR